MLGMSRLERSFGVGKCESIAFLIDDEEHVALVHELVIFNADLVDVAGNVRRHRNNVGADPGVSSPRRIEVIDRQIVAKQTSCGDQDESKQETYDGVHLIVPSVKGHGERAAAKETNEKGEAGQWCVPEQPVEATPRQQCVDWNEYRQREHEPGG